MRTAIAALMAIIFCLLGAAPAAGSSHMDRTAPGQAQDGGDQEVPPDAGRIIGSPDPGPDPEHPGDRGGWAQLMTLGALAAGVGFIMWRIIRATRKSPGSAIPDP